MALTRRDLERHQDRLVRRIEGAAPALDLAPRRLDDDIMTRAASKLRVGDLNGNDIAAIVADSIKASERRVLEHVGRVAKLFDAKQGANRLEAKFSNLHRRLVEVESQLRHMRK